MAAKRNDTKPAKKAAKKAPAKKAVKKAAVKKPPKKPVAKAEKKPKTTLPKKASRKGGAPKGNQFWKLRAKHGRDKLFASPELLLEAFYDYAAHCDQNPWLKIEQLKKPYQKKVGGKTVWVTTTELPTQRPYTLSGFGLFCEASESYLQDFERRMKAQTDSVSQDFLRVITHIRETIATQQLEGATVGAFNASIIARKLGLTDKKDITTDGESLNKGYYEYLKQRRTRTSNA